jgi:Ca-activated chloride channel family protein
MKTLWCTILLIFCICSFVYTEPNDDKTLSPYFFVQGDSHVDHLPLKDTQVNISISGIIADVTVTQTYANEGSRPINASYIFPLSTRAAVYGMVMKIGNEIFVAKIKEREHAKKDFQKAKSEGKSASLLEQERPNVFSMSVANVVPGETIQVELKYTETLVPTENIYEFVFPTVVGPRYSSQPESTASSTEQWIKSPYLHQQELPKSAFHITATISAGVPIQDLVCPSHQINPRWKSISVAELSLEEADVFQANRDFILRYRLAGEQLNSGIILYRSHDENFFLFMAQPPARVTDADIPPREYIFVVDVSGSMEGFPLDTTKQLLRDLIGNLKSTDRFNVVLFAGGSYKFAEKSVAATPQNVSQAISIIDSQRGGGGTELLAALKDANEIPRDEQFSRTTLLITDGYISAEKEVFEYIRSHLDQSNIFAFGIGTSVNRYLIEGVASAGLGEPFIVLNPGEAPKIATKFRDYIAAPVLTDIQVTWNGLDAYDVTPQKIPDLFAQRPIVLFGKWRGSAQGIFQLTGKTGRGLFETSVSMNAVKPEERNSALRYLWARTRIAELSDYGSPQTDQDNISQITSLGLAYNLLTQYTSFIAIREVVTNPNPAQDVTQPLPLPKGVSNAAVGQTVVSQSEPELLWLIVLLVCFFLSRSYRSNAGVHMARQGGRDVRGTE